MMFLKNKIQYFPILCLVFVACQQHKNRSKINPQKPNIVVIYADDLGYGDVSCYGSKTLQTPNIDRIANEGIRFTNGYATSPTCTPSRYALLSGEYPFRQKRAQVLPGNAPLLFDTTKQTLPSMLKTAGYHTGVVGKWHLGLGDAGMDWNEDIKPGPMEIGFDENFIMASTNDRVPSVYVKNHNVYMLSPSDSLYVSYRKNFDGQPTGKTHPQLLKLYPSHGHDMTIHNGISRIGFMKGGHSARFKDEVMSDDFLREAKAFVTRQKNKPFFLFYALHQPHVPRVPHPRFEGTSGMGARGDVILEADWAVGQFLDHLDALGISENTIVIFTSDNGPVLDDGYIDEAVTKIGDHKPAGNLRGGKYSLFDAGTHVPFMLRWKGKIKPQVSKALVCQIDFNSSFAALVGETSQTPDSENILNAFLGKDALGRKDLILGTRTITAYREGKWLLIPPHKGRKMTNKWVNIETGRDENYQLYDLENDPSQKKNIAEKHPEKLTELIEKLDAKRK